MTGQIKNISDLDKRLAELEQIEAEQKEGLRNCGKSIGASFAPFNMFKMAIKGVRTSPPISGAVLAETAVIAGTAIAEKVFGKEKFDKIQKITAPFVRIALGNLIKTKKQEPVN